MHTAPDLQRKGFDGARTGAKRDTYNSWCKILIDAVKSEAGPGFMAL